MLPFPKSFEIPKFEKYKGKGDLVEHVRDFSVSYMEVKKNESYLMRLFPHSLTGHAMEWFSHLPPGFKKFDELTTKFLNHFSFNIEQDVTIIDLYKIKQSQGESFTSYLQTWRHKASRCYKWPILDKELVDIFVSNVQN